ncbi:hypothetical protein LTR15_002637 [Elasticomyces elasticus]|nr:hypothetical protein LTR15_002637 [Elasticomyces elasticus]
MKADEVMHLPELLETILVNLPTRDLLFASRICKTWKSTIDSSPRIQRALFLKPGAVNPLLIAANERNPCWHMHRSLWTPTALTESCMRMFTTQPPTPTRARYSIWPTSGELNGEPGLLNYWRIEVAMASHQTFGALAEQYVEALEEKNRDSEKSYQGGMELLSPCDAWRSEEDEWLSEQDEGVWLPRWSIQCELPEASEEIASGHTIARSHSTIVSNQGIKDSSATQQVLSLPELLENILLRLPMKDLLLAHRLCKKFKQIMHGSPSIQRALFFMRGAISDLNYVGRPHQQEHEIRTLKTGHALNALITTYCYESIVGGAFRPAFPFSDQRAIHLCHRMSLTQPPSATILRFCVQEMHGGRLTDKPSTVRVAHDESFGELTERFEEADLELDLDGFTICSLLQIVDGLTETGVDEGGKWDWSKGRRKWWPIGRSDSYDFHCHSNLTRAVLPYGLTEFDVHDVLNVFQVTGLNADGKYFTEASPAKRGDFIEFFTEQPVLMALSTCPGGDLSTWGWGEGGGGEEGEKKSMLDCFRPLKVEVFRLDNDNILSAWREPTFPQYRGRHGMDVPMGEAPSR